MSNKELINDLNGAIKELIINAYEETKPKCDNDELEPQPQDLQVEIPQPDGSGFCTA